MQLVIPNTFLLWIEIKMLVFLESHTLLDYQFSEVDTTQIDSFGGSNKTKYNDFNVEFVTYNF